MRTRQTANETVNQHRDWSYSNRKFQPEGAHALLSPNTTSLVTTTSTSELSHVRAQRANQNMAAARAARPATAPTTGDPNIAAHMMKRGLSRTQPPMFYSSFCLLQIAGIQSYIVTPHSAGCLWSVFLLLKVLNMLKTSKSGGAHPPALWKCTPKIHGTFCEKTKLPCLESRKGCSVGGKYLTHGVSYCRGHRLNDVPAVAN